MDVPKLAQKIVGSTLVLFLLVGCRPPAATPTPVPPAKPTEAPRMPTAAPPATAMEFDTPSSFPTGLTWDGQYLWNCDFNSETIYAIDPADGSVIKSFRAPGTDPEGLTWDGKYLWHVDSGNSYTLGCAQAKLYIYKIDPRSGEAVQKFEAPGPGCNAEDLAWDGTYLWYVDGGKEERTDGTSSIYKMDPDSGRIVANFDTPGEHPSGIAWDGSYLWLSDYALARIYKIDPRSGNVLSSLDALSDYPGGLAWDGRYLWCADWRSGKIYRMDIGEE